MARFLQAMALSAGGASERRMPISSRSFSRAIAGPSPRAVAAAMTNSAGRKTTDVADGRDECMRAILMFNQACVAGISLLVQEFSLAICESILDKPLHPTPRPFAKGGKRCVRFRRGFIASTVRGELRSAGGWPARHC